MIDKKAITGIHMAKEFLEVDNQLDVLYPVTVSLTPYRLAVVGEIELEAQKIDNQWHVTTTRIGNRPKDTNIPLDNEFLLATFFDDQSLEIVTRHGTFKFKKGCWTAPITIYFTLKHVHVYQDEDVTMYIDNFKLLKATRTENQETEG